MKYTLSTKINKERKFLQSLTSKVKMGNGGIDVKGLTRC